MRNAIFSGPAQSKVDVREAQASEAILPGRVLVLDGANNEFDLAGADQGGQVYFAGRNPHDNEDDAYAADDTVQGYVPSSGQYYNLRLAASQTITEGDALTTNASGDLVAIGEGSNTIAYAAESVTTTGAAGQIRVYIK